LKFEPTQKKWRNHGAGNHGTDLFKTHPDLGFPPGFAPYDLHHGPNSRQVQAVELRRAAFPNIMVPMGDDVRLNGKVVEGKFPLILERTPCLVLRRVIR